MPGDLCTRVYINGMQVAAVEDSAHPGDGEIGVGGIRFAFVGGEIRLADRPATGQPARHPSLDCFGGPDADVVDTALQATCGWGLSGSPG